MKKQLTILITLLTFFSVVLESNKGIFLGIYDVEQTEKKNTESKDTDQSIDGNDFDLKEKYIATSILPTVNLSSNSKFHIKNCRLISIFFSSMIEMPPEL